MTDNKTTTTKAPRKYHITSKPTYAMGTLFLGTSLYFIGQKKTLMTKISLVSSGLFFISGQGALLAGGLSAALAASTTASALSHRKLFPLVLGTLTFSSMAYHAFFPLYNNIDEVKDIIDKFNDDVKQNKEVEKNRGN
eukprot:gene3829-4420_t